MRRVLAASFVATVGTVGLVAPVLAHGDHDARPLARELPAGPYAISVWQVYPDAGIALTPHLIVMFDGLAAVPAGADVRVAVNGAATGVERSTTTANGWESSDGVGTWDVIDVTIVEGGQAWHLDSIIVNPAPSALLPMRELIYASIVLTAAAALWAARRTARAWRRSAVLSS
jgi:hypothetical protein